MAFTVSGIYVQNMIDVYDATQLVMDLSLSTGKIALFTNSVTINYDTDITYSSTNEIPNGGGYTTGGVTAGASTNTVSPAGSWMHDLTTDPQWTSATFSLVRGCEYYVALATKLVCAVWFGGADYAVTSGTFTIQWAATGVFAIDLTP